MMKEGTATTDSNILLADGGVAILTHHVEPKMVDVESGGAIKDGIAAAGKSSCSSPAPPPKTEHVGTVGTTKAGVGGDKRNLELYRETSNPLYLFHEVRAAVEGRNICVCA